MPKSTSPRSSSKSKEAPEKELEKSGPETTAKPKKSKKERRRNIWKIIAVIAAILFLTGIIGAGVAFAYYVKDLPDPQKLIDRHVAETTKIYDRTGKIVLYEIHGDQNRTRISIKDLPSYVKNASVAIEDKDFYTHKGISLIGIARSVYVDVIQHRKAQGGSTITQQLVKKSILTSEKSYDRKIKEIILALEIERKFSKDQILELYLNEIPYGSNAYGLQAAAETFFNKQPKDLTVAEAALLASLPNAPTYYSPYGTHTDDLKARQQSVIDRLEEQKYITHDQAETARAEELHYSDRNDAGIIAPHFVFYLREQLEDTYGSKTLEQDGLKIISTLDYNIQLKAEKAISDNIDKVKKHGGDNAALAAVDPKTGEILAMVGSVDYFNTKAQGNVNAAARPLQPGSSFKPYVYATAFAKGLTPDTIVYDLDTDFGHGYKPYNYDKSQHGPLKLKQALPMSLNIPAVKVGYLVGPENAAATARAMGNEELKEGATYGLSTAIGASPVKLVDHVGAFGVFANQGKKVQKTGILKVVDAKGKVLEQHDPTKFDQVLDANVANTINSILSDNSLRAPTFGSNSALKLSRPAAVKTGTTNDFKDAWTVGFAPNLSAGVWAGNTNGTKMRTGADGSIVAAPIWRQFMEDVLKDMPVEQFAKATPMTSKSNPYVAGAQLPDKEIKLCRPSMKLATAACPPDLLVTKTYKEVHGELFYIDRSNLSGPPPQHPEKDPLFKNFETPVIAWAQKNGQTVDQAPTETDTDHNKENWPIVTITAPADGTTITDASIPVIATIKAPLGIQKAEFFFDSTIFATDKTGPYAATYDASAASNGFHKLRVRVTDLAQNIGDTTITVKLNIAHASPTVSMTAPGGTDTVAPGTAYTTSAIISNMTAFGSITFFYTDAATGNSTAIGSVTTPSADGRYSATWTAPLVPGSYGMYATATETDGTVYRSNTTTLIVQ